MRIYTLGSEERSEAEVSKILSKYQIQVVADIRLSHTLTPDHLKREVIQRLCKENKAEYIYLGNELGTGQDISSLDPDLYKRGIGILKSLARTRGLLVLGTNRSPSKCIRRLIAEELAKEGAEVLHLLDLETTWNPSTRQTPDKTRRRPDPRHGNEPRGRYKNKAKSSNAGHRSVPSRNDSPPLKKRTPRSKMDKFN